MRSPSAARRDLRERVVEATLVSRAGILEALNALLVVHNDAYVYLKSLKNQDLVRGLRHP
ncbi:hypothetical protein Scel_29260 [Streptomyces cellostaticus]|nr:hypothetical protein Scel_29260 [Streptomyces cellostaticus]